MSDFVPPPMKRNPGHGRPAMGTETRPEQRQYAGAFRRAGDNLLTSINDILDLSKIEAGRIDLQFPDFDLDEVVAADLDLIRVRADDKGLERRVANSRSRFTYPQGRSGPSAPGLDQPAW